MCFDMIINSKVEKLLHEEYLAMLIVWLQTINIWQS